MNANFNDSRYFRGALVSYNKVDHSPLFSSAKLKIAIAAVKVIWVSSDD